MWLHAVRGDFQHVAWYTTYLVLNNVRILCGRLEVKVHPEYTVLAAKQVCSSSYRVPTTYLLGICTYQPRMLRGKSAEGEGTTSDGQLRFRWLPLKSYT